MSASQLLEDSRSSRTVSHVLLISQTYPPACLSEALVTAKFATLLDRAGIRVTVITSDDYSTAEHDHSARLFHSSAIKVFRLPGCRHAMFIKAARHFVSAMRERTCIGAAYFVESGSRLFRERLSGDLPDIIYARGLPTHGYFLGARLSKSYGIPFIVHLSDPWPKRHWPRPYSSRPDLAELWEALHVDSVYSQADAVTFPNQALAEYMADQLPFLRKKATAVLPHPLPDDELAAVGRDLLAQDRNPRCLEIVYSGQLDEHRNPERFLAALKQFLIVNPGAARVTFIGSRWPALERKVRELSLDRDVAIIGVASYPDVLATTRRADLLLLIEAPLATGIFLPGKFVDYCWTGKSILALSPAAGEVASYLKSIETPVIPPDSPIESITGVLKNLYASWQSRGVPSPGSEPLKTCFSVNVTVDRFLALAQGVLGVHRD